MDPKVGNGASNNAKQNKGKEKEEESGEEKEFTNEELEEQILIYEMKLRRLKDERIKRECSSSLEQLERKKLYDAQDGVQRYMLKMTEKYELCGFIYGIVPQYGKPVSGSSENLSRWWKDKVKFDRNGPAAILKYEEENGSFRMDDILNGEPATPSSLHTLSDPTLGSLLSTLMPQCKPTQRSYPMGKGIHPPWWPTGKEPWWHEMGFSEDKDPGPPPYKKPHNLKKGWKVCVLTAIIKHLSPDFKKMKAIISRSSTLQDKLTAKETATWFAVINNQERIYREPLPEPQRVDHGSSFVGSYLAGGSGGEQNQDWVDWDSLSNILESSGNKRKTAEPYEVANKRSMSYMHQYENYSLQEEMNVRNNHHSESTQIGSSSSSINIGGGGSSSMNNINNQFQMVDVGGSETHQDVAPIDQHVHAAIPAVPNEVTHHTGNYSGGRGEEVMNTIPTRVVNQDMQPEMDNNFNGEQEVVNMQPNVVGHANVSTFVSSFDDELEAFISQFDGDANNNIPFINDSSTVDEETPDYDYLAWFLNNH